MIMLTLSEVRNFIDGLNEDELEKLSAMVREVKSNVLFERMLPQLKGNIKSFNIDSDEKFVCQIGKDKDIKFFNHILFFRYNNNTLGVQFYNEESKRNVP